MQAINFVVQINISTLSHLRDLRSRDIPVYTRSVCFQLFRPHSNSLGDMWIYRRPNIPQGRPEWSHTWCTSASGSAELNCCNKRWRNWLEKPQFWQVNALSIFTEVLFPQQKYPRQNAASKPCLANEPPWSENIGCVPLTWANRSVHGLGKYNNNNNNNNFIKKQRNTLNIHTACI